MCPVVLEDQLWRTTGRLEKHAISHSSRVERINESHYFYMVGISRYKKISNRSRLTYPDIPSSIAPVPHNDQLPAPIPSNSSLHLSDKDRMEILSISNGKSQQPRKQCGKEKTAILTSSPYKQELEMHMTQKTKKNQ